MLLSTLELERRRPVWEAFSDLYLDTETRWYLPRIAWVAARSGYPWVTLEGILRYEVGPVVSHNLLEVAGEWAMFDPEWLEGQILQNGPRECPQALEVLGRNWTAVRQLFEHLQAASEGEFRLVEALAYLKVEREWQHAHLLESYFQRLVSHPLERLEEHAEVVERIYRPLLRHEDDPGFSDWQRQWEDFVRFHGWAAGRVPESRDAFVELLGEWRRNG